MNIFSAEFNIVYNLSYCIFKGSEVVIGVTSYNPQTFTKVPFVNELPDSRILSGGLLFKNGRQSTECPPLTVNPGDTYGISWQPQHVTFYTNGTIHYRWLTEMCGRREFWVYTRMNDLEKTTLFSEEEYETL